MHAWSDCLLLSRKIIIFPSRFKFICQSSSLLAKMAFSQLEPRLSSCRPLAVVMSQAWWTLSPRKPLQCSAWDSVMGIHLSRDLKNRREVKPESFLGHSIKQVLRNALMVCAFDCGLKRSCLGTHEVIFSFEGRIFVTLLPCKSSCKFSLWGKSTSQGSSVTRAVSFAIYKTLKDQIYLKINF